MFSIENNTIHSDLLTCVVFYSIVGEGLIWYSYLERNLTFLTRETTLQKSITIIYKKEGPTKLLFSFTDRYLKVEDIFL